MSVHSPSVPAGNSLGSPMGQPRNLEVGLDLLASLCRENGSISAHMVEQKRTTEARLQCLSL